MKKKDTIFIYGGFRQHNYLYLFPLLKGYLKNKKIKNIIIERRLAKKILENQYYSFFLKDYNVIVLNDLIKKKFIFGIFISLNLILKIFVILFLKKIEKNMMNRKKNFFEDQIDHAVWDTGIRWNKKKIDSIELFSKFKSFFLISRSIIITKIILKFFNLESLFLAHRVYGERLSLAIFRQKNIKIFFDKNYKIDRIIPQYDIEVGKVDKKTFIKTYKFLTDKIINTYWNKYKLGKSNYFEARIASKSQNINIKKSAKSFKNVIFLHIFRDSPFDTIDRRRIFFDYSQWITNTLNILKDSEEEWLLREHPSAKRWGENSKEILQSILDTNFNGKLPQNVKYSSENVSNIDQFKTAKRVVTYSGNAHLEAGCFGIKPIILSNCTIVKFDREIFLKPKSFTEYKKLLMKNSADRIFTLKSNQIKIFRRIIFIKQNLLDFRKELNAFKIFYIDDKKYFKKLFNKIYKSKKLYKDYFEKFGENLGKKINQSINSKYLKYFI